MKDDYGPWGAYNDLLAGPPGDDLLAFVAAVTGGPPARVLEFGVGSGRIALPLSDVGYDVTGIDSSRTMLDLLAQQDPRGAVRTIHADFTHPVDADDFDLVLVAYNALSMQPDLDAQRATLRNAASAVRPGGVIAIENVAPHAVLSQVNAHNQAVGVKFVDDDAWLYLARYYPETQRYLARYVAFHDGQIVERSGDLTLIDPEGVRRLAGEVGLDVVSIAGDWEDAPMVATSPTYVATLRRRPLPTDPVHAEEQREVTSTW